MKTHKIETLLKKYYAGNSSLQEEQQLRAYFSHSQDIPPQLRAEQAIFNNYTRMAQTQHANISAMLDSATRVSNPVRPLPTIFSKLFSKPITKPIMAIAASLLVISLITNYLLPMHKAHTPATLTDTYNNPKQARQAIKTILGLVGRKYNKGTAQLAELRQFNHAIEQLKLIDQIPTRPLIEPGDQRRSL